MMGGAKIKKLIIPLLIICLLIPIALAQDDRVIINSADWTDVYSGMLYAKLTGKQPNFLTSARHATILTYSIPKTANSIEVISSRSQPYAAGYQALLEIEGYNNVEETRYTNPNVQLLKNLPNINKFIIVDSTYGYNAISVAPLAALGQYYVLFADRRTISQVVNALEDVDVKELIIYGQVDREVKTALEQYTPEIINTGDRFENNIEIVKKYQEVHKELYGKSRQQAILNNGEFIESSLMSGADPVLFIGFSNVPDQVREYITNSDLEVGTLVGNELIGTATYIRRQTGLSVFVKFGQGSRTPQGTITQVEDLDRFPIPRYSLNLEVTAASINTATNNLEITYGNNAPLATYFKPISILITDANSNYQIADPDEAATFIDGNDFKTVIYSMQEDGNDISLEGDINAQITTVYGESPRSLEQTILTNISVQKISIIDGTDIEIVDASYQKSGSKFLIDIKNIAQIDAYVAVELQDVYVNGEYIIFSSTQTILIKPGKTETIVVETTMEEEDIIENPEIQIKALYGERKNALTKTKQATMPFKLAAMDYTTIIVVILIIILLLLIFLRKKCDNCGYKNPIGKKKCKKCHHRL